MAYTRRPQSFLRYSIALVYHVEWISHQPLAFLSASVLILWICCWLEVLAKLLLSSFKCKVRRSADGHFWAHKGHEYEERWDEVAKLLERTSPQNAPNGFLIHKCCWVLLSKQFKSGDWFTVVLTTLLNYTLRSASEDSIGGIADG